MRHKLVPAQPLMGLPNAHRLPANRNAAYRLIGDGVAAPAVRRLATAHMPYSCRLLLLAIIGNGAIMQSFLGHPLE